MAFMAEAYLDTRTEPPPKTTGSHRATSDSMADAVKACGKARRSSYRSESQSWIECVKRIAYQS